MISRIIESETFRRSTLSNRKLRPLGSSFLFLHFQNLLKTKNLTKPPIILRFSSNTPLIHHILKFWRFKQEVSTHFSYFQFFSQLATFSLRPSLIQILKSIRRFHLSDSKIWFVCRLSTETVMFFLICGVSSMF